MGRTVPVMMGFDRGYMFPSGVAIHSVLEHADPSDRYRFYILTEEENVGMDDGFFELLAAKFSNFTWEYRTIPAEVFANIQLSVRYSSAATYYRLLAARLLPELEYGIYLDGDIAVFGDIADMLDCCMADSGTFFSDCYLAAAKDIGLRYGTDGFFARHRASIGFSNEDITGYFNAGVLVMNLKKIREDGLEERFVSLLANNYTFVDQDILNMVCKGQVRYLPARFNIVANSIHNRYYAYHVCSDPRDREDLLADNESGTLLNRVTQGLYPPGSTFKIIDCIDLLQEDPDAMENYSFNCSGVFEQDGESIHCYEYERHGEVDLEESFEHSCNSSFANIGVNLISPETMSDTLRTLLFNSKLPYDLPYVRSSINMPDTLSTEGIMQMAIGQGTTAMTPLHLNMITSAVANGGVLMKPHLADELHDAKGRTLKVYDPEEYGTLMSEEVAEQVTALMRSVVTEGTANSLSGRDYEAAGKTGSAEFDNNKSSHAWFTGFAPASDPEICITVLIEGKGMGSSYAVPVAGQIFDAYFE